MNRAITSKFGKPQSKKSTEAFAPVLQFQLKEKLNQKIT